MRIVVALGGNALLGREEELTTENQRANVRTVCDRLAPIARKHDLVIAHGNGPQNRLLAEEDDFHENAVAPLDVLGAEAQGMIGYLIELELGNRLPADKPVASLLTMVEIYPNDPAFDDPSKPIGPLYTRQQAERLAADRGWVFTPDGTSMRRAVPSPAPRRVVEHRPIGWLLDQGCAVVCAGGGGVPTIHRDGRELVGIEAVIDKDHASALLAHDIHADMLIMATDAPGAYVRFGKPDQRIIWRANPDVLLDRYRSEFALGSMLPKVTAACNFARATGKPAVIGAVADIDAMLSGRAGSFVSTSADGVELEPLTA